MLKYSFLLLHRENNMLQQQRDSVNSHGLTFTDHWTFPVIKNPHQLPNLLLSVNSASFYSNKNTVRPLSWGQSCAYAWKGTWVLCEGQTCSIALELLLTYKVTIFVSSQPVTNHPGKQPIHEFCQLSTHIVTSAFRSPKENWALRPSPWSGGTGSLLALSQ